jgi:hypothetical protein
MTIGHTLYLYEIKNNNGKYMSFIDYKPESNNFRFIKSYGDLSLEQIRIAQNKIRPFSGDSEKLEKELDKRLLPKNLVTLLEE